MTRHLLANLWLLLLTLVICSVLYPLALWAVGRTAFREQAEGSLVRDGDGRPIGSRLIAQPFTGKEYFHPRPSAVSYNAAAAGASNWGASNPALRQRVEEDLSKLRQTNPAARRPAPADAVMTSGSGLDPHITLENALYQLDRVAAEWAATTGRERAATKAVIEALLRAHAAAPLGGLAGEPLVNVLEVNLAVRDRMRSSPAPR